MRWQRKSKYTAPVLRGDSSELYCASYLMRRGVVVYRCLSHAGPCDLIALGNDRTPYKIEVKSATYDAHGRPKGEVLQAGYGDGAAPSFDLIAWVLPDGLVKFIARPGITAPDWAQQHLITFAWDPKTKRLKRMRKASSRARRPLQSSYYVRAAPGPRRAKSRR